jgi:hypothetical protein
MKKQILVTILLMFLSACEVAVPEETTPTMIEIEEAKQSPHRGV